MEQIKSYMRDYRKVSDFLAFLINFLKAIIKDCFVLFFYINIIKKYNRKNNKIYKYFI